MQTVNIELQPILSGVLQFVSYMVLAVFAENVVLARALGVSRLMKLVPDHRTQIWDFCLPLLLIMTLSALPAGPHTTCFSHGCATICRTGCRSRPCAPLST